MNKLFCVAAALSVLMLSGCASTHMSIQPIVSSKQAPAMSTGYVAGMFSRNWDPSKTGFGLGIVNTATAEEYVMPFGKETILPTDVVDEVAMIQLPPGEYRIAYWITYSSKEMEQLTRTEVAADSAGGLPFTLTAGDVIFVGGHVTRRERNGINGNKPWMVHHQRLTLQAVQKAFLRSYPAFATQPMSCPSCLK